MTPKYPFNVSVTRYKAYVETLRIKKKKKILFHFEKERLSERTVHLTLRKAVSLALVRAKELGIRGGALRLHKVAIYMDRAEGLLYLSVGTVTLAAERSCGQGKEQGTCQKGTSRGTVE